MLSRGSMDIVLTDSQFHGGSVWSATIFFARGSPIDITVHGLQCSSLLHCAQYIPLIYQQNLHFFACLFMSTFTAGRGEFQSECTIKLSNRQSDRWSLQYLPRQQVYTPPVWQHTAWQQLPHTGHMQQSHSQVPFCSLVWRRLSVMRSMFYHMISTSFTAIYT